MQKEIVEGYRLSPQQKHLWLLQQTDHNQTYRAQCAIKIEGNLDTTNLKMALQDVVNRHEILRTKFHCLPEMILPIQVIADSTILSLQYHNLKDLNPQEKNAKIETLFDEISNQHFDLGHTPLLHITLVELSLSHYLLFLSLPAICADTATLNNLVRELSHSYAAYLQGKPLLDEPIQYADVSEIFNELIESKETELGKEYWCQQEISAIFTLKFPFEHQPAKKQEFTPKFITQTINPELALNIEATARTYNTSISILFLACWQILIGRITGQLDVIVGIACDGRTYEGLEEALGLFAKYLPLHCHLAENLRFNEMLKQVDESISKLSEWQEYFTWEQNVESISNGIELSFFPIGFEFEERDAKYSVGNVSFSISKQYTCVDRFKVKLCCVRWDESLSYEFHYDANVFAVEDIQRLAGQFETLLASVVKNPSGAIASFDILSPKEREQILVEFNNTKTAAPQHQCIHHWFESQCDRTPDNIAVVCENQQLSYSELNARANQLAHHLQQMGVGSEVMVGICVERSLSMVIGLLAILKAGGAYVPLDPSYPKERLAYMLEDSQPRVLLTQQQLVETLPTHNAQIICLNSDWELIAQHSKENPDDHLSSDNLAYIIYTSGSTGQPKGAMNTHRGICNRLLWMQDKYQLTTTDRVLQKTPFSFDVSVWEFFWPLITGARLVVAQPEGHRDPNYLINIITQQQITTIHFVPSMLQLFLEAENLEISNCLQRVIVSGEALPVQLQQRFFNRLNAQLHNLYGPTEAAVDVTFWQCQDSITNQNTVPIGRPIANIQIYLLDCDLNPVPIGVSGELYIGGVGVGRGYFNRPDLTAEKFIPNPFSDNSATRLYKTGDLARYLANGEIEYIGRTDYQIKIRGFRIELGEIEALINEYPAVRETVVVAADAQSLVAYVVLQAEQTLVISQLRHFLESKLPNYMVPAAFVLLETLPLTPNGKVDRKALKAPDTVRPQLEAVYQPPQTEVEQTIADIWQNILQIEDVGIYDNFFELGGYSLLLIQVHSKLREIFQIDLSVLDLFRYPTINSLANSFNQDKNQQISSYVTEMITEKIADGKAQQRKRLQQLKSI
ncbi:MAG: amino acid adenylation domain-containing protein [Nostoc sp. DedSLP03]|uniref:non-ribosomal peptide synthetase n=1 Tax=Nostoc sp. DedSLP03 TaxID=3075400 RepID=UPI002AD20F84|nr:amino acid adenylation domain-containing protein [Nostoc sp. DedSLP03]MDZ7967875.1 amino acid adenylation domain-containing protein [Nostoc sp. DedSLP03]